MLLEIYRRALPCERKNAAICPLTRTAIPENAVACVPYSSFVLRRTEYQVPFFLFIFPVVLRSIEHLERHICTDRPGSVFQFAILKTI